MQSTSQTWKSIVASGAFTTECTLAIGEAGLLLTHDGDRLMFGNDNILIGSSGADAGYGMDRLISVETTISAFSGEVPAVGATVAGEIDVVMLRPLGDIPRQARLAPYIRVKNATAQLRVQNDLISAEVSARTQAMDELYSALSVQADRITAEVSERNSAVADLYSALDVQPGEINAKVSATSTGTFSWTLRANSWTLKSNGSTVLRASASGVEVTGKITATSGKIGGFTIQNNYLSTNGQEWYGTNTSGIYIGPNGIQLGNNFRVDSQGNLSAQNGTFNGYVRANMISAGGDAGYINGGQIGSNALWDSNLILEKWAPEEYRHDIYDHAKSLGFTIDEYKVTVNGAQLFKEYKTRLYEGADNARKIYDDVFGVEFKDFYDGKKLIAWAWYGLCRFEKAIPKALNPMYGFRLRQGNIQIGDNTAVASLFKEDRGNSYFIGEIFTVDKNLIPNSQRNYFNETPARINLEEQLRAFFYDELHRLYHVANETKNHYRKLEAYSDAIAKLQDKHANGFVDKKEQSRMETAVEEARKKKDAAKKKLEKTVETLSASSTLTPEQRVQKEIQYKFEKKNVPSATQKAEKKETEIVGQKEDKKSKYFTDNLSVHFYKRF